MLPIFSKICVFNNTLGHKQLILLLPQQLSEYRVDPNKLFLEVCHTRYHEKKWSTIFFTGMIAFFPEIFVFNNLLGDTEMI